MRNDLFRDVIRKFLAGNATAPEKEMLSNWLRDDPKAEEIFYFEVSKREDECPQYLPEIDSKVAAYENFLNGGIRMTESRHENRVLARRPVSYYRWLVASILLMAACVYVFSDFIFYKTYSARKGTIKTVSLQDGSVVTLNANSSIKIQRDFMNHASREVWIKGEAYFEVTKKSDRMKFIVHTRNFDVEVLGTKFNVNDRRCNTEVMLAEGKVKLVTKDKVREPLIMEPGEKVTFSSAAGRFKRQAADPARYEAWRNNMLVFTNTPLSEVVAVIQDYYGIQMRVSDSLLVNREFTGTLPNDDLNIVLVALTTAYNIRFEYEGDHVILTNQ